MMQMTVLLADLSPMLEDIVFHLLRNRGDLRIVRGSAAANGIQAAAASVGAQLVIVERPDPSALCALDDGIAQAAGLSVLALTADGTRGCLHALKPTARRLDDISGAQLMAALASVEPAGRA
jgi:hypothetical protein